MVTIPKDSVGLPSLTTVRLRSNQGAKKNFFEMVDEILKRTSRYDPKEIQSAIDEATGISK